MTPLEKAARAAYEDWIADVRDLEPAWDDLPESHRDRMIASQRAALMAVREPDEIVASAGGMVLASNLNGDPFDAVNGLIDEATGNDYGSFETAVEAFTPDASETFTAMIDHILRGGE